MRRAASFLFGLLSVSTVAFGFAGNDHDIARSDATSASALSQMKEFAEYGDMAAQFNLALSYEFGIGVPHDDEQAVYWYKKAAEQGLASAQSNLGVMYAKGKGVSQDAEQAVYWYTRAAEQGDSKAQNNLGAEYYRGQGVGRDDMQAYRWWSLAAAQGNAHAQRNLRILEKRTSAEQIATAQKIPGSPGLRAPAAPSFALPMDVRRSRDCIETVSPSPPSYPCFYD